MTTNNERMWVLLEEGYPHTVLLTQREAEILKYKWQSKYPRLSYTIIYDAYYEYTPY